MAHLSLQTATYFGAESALRGRTSRKIGHNTVLRETGASYAVRYWSTDIFTMNPDGTIDLDTGGWETVTTLSRINALLPGPYGIHSHRVGKVSSLYLYVRGYPVTPYTDGLTIDPAAETVSYAGSVILTADDIAAIITAAQDRRAVLDARRETRRLADHAARPAGPSSTFRHGWDCDDCRTLQAAERDARRAIMSAEHDAMTHALARVARLSIEPEPWTPAEYAAAGSHVSRWGSGSLCIGCPWDCPKR